MRPFSVRSDRFCATFSAAEVALLADLVGQVRLLLDRRRAEAPTDPLAELTGMALGPATVPGDPAVARLLPDFHRDDAQLAAGLRVLREPEVIAAKNEAAQALIASLPPHGGHVELTAATARAWLVALNDVRLVFGVRLEITDDGSEPAAARAEASSAEYAMYAAYRWLSGVQESLATTLLEVHHDGR